jgi:chemotaxis protein MotA
LSFEPSLFVDPAALAIVLAGTALGTLARCGWRGMGAGLAGAFGLARRDFDPAANRAALARALQMVRERGVLGADPALPPDRTMRAMLERFLRSRSREAALEEADAVRAAHQTQAERAAGVFDTAGELAPVFGLVGTLIAIAQLAPGSAESMVGLAMGAVAQAVISTLYGVTSAHLVWYPLARAIERREAADAAARAGIVRWFAQELARPRSVRGSPVRGVA